MHAIKTSVMH